MALKTLPICVIVAGEDQTASTNLSNNLYFSMKSTANISSY